MKQLDQIISKHLLISISIGFIAGIGAGSLLIPGENTIRFLLFSLLLTLAIVTSLYSIGLNRIIFLPLPFLFAILGIVHISSSLQTPRDNDHIYNHIKTKTEVVLTGTMTKMATFNGRTGSTIINIDAIRLKDNSHLISVRGKILVRIKGKWPEKFVPGDKLVIRAHLKRPKSYTSPGSFDYAKFLARKNIWITGFIRTPAHIEKLKFTESFPHRVRYFPEKIRARIGTTIDSAFSDQRSCLYRAILLGDRTHVPNQTLEMFKSSGTMHILAISGMHLAVIGTLLYIVIYWFLSRSEKLLLRFHVPKITACCCLPLLVFYAFLAGMNTPVTRAVIMSGVVILAVATERRKSAAPLVAAASLIILIFDPIQLFTVSFQLSFAAISGILFLIPLLQKTSLNVNKDGNAISLPRTILHWLTAALLVSTVATMATAPISLSAFNRISTVGPLANILVEPFLCLWALPFGIISVPFTFFLPSVSDWLLNIGSYGILGALHIVKFFSSLSYSSIWLPSPSPLIITTYYATLCFLLFQRAVSCGKILLIGIVLVSCGLIAAFPDQIIRIRSKAVTKIAFLDVGQGSATIIEFKSGEKVLIDGGGSSFSTVSVGEKVIAPYLWTHGIGRIDTVIITHPDADHYNGLPFIIEHFQPKTVWVSDAYTDDRDFKSLIRSAEDKGVQVKVPSAGQILSDRGDYLECLFNFKQEKSKKFQDSRKYRNFGLVIKARLEDQCVLFPGDINSTGERHLLKEQIDLKASVLLAAHHGSKSSNSKNFLKAVNPELVVVSAGSRSAHFPHESLLQKCAGNNIQLLNTAQSGTIEIVRVKDDENKRIFIYKKYYENPLNSLEKTIFR